jgi:transposase
MTVTERQLTLELSSTRRTARCPDCQRRSRRAHSRYTRRLADLPLGEVSVYVHLHARRFRCLNPACSRQTFRERLPESAPYYQRRTPPLRRCLEAVGFALGGQAGRRLVRHLQVAPAGASRNTLLRLVRRADVPDADVVAPELRVLGVDDFAFRRGMRYGAILVDLEQHRVLDLLPDREAATVARWLEQHHGEQIQVVSRDRSGAFAEGARQGAPHAVQVADRFHLLQNLGQALDRLLTREHRVLTRVAAAVTVPKDVARAGCTATTLDVVPGAQSVGPPSGHDSPSAACMTRVEREQAAVEERRLARYERVVALASAGYSLREVARRAEVSRETVRSYLRAGHYRPCTSRARKPHACDLFAAYLRHRWNEGEHNSAALYAEIRRQGYTGAASTVRQYVRSWRTGPRRPGRRRRGEDNEGVPPLCRRRFSPRQTRWVLLRALDELDVQERAYRQALCQDSATIACAQTLVEDFDRIVRTRAPGDLDAWLETAGTSHIPELTSFVKGIRRDYAAVAAALTSPHSQGQTEGQVNRLKMLKRQTYGRANFDLLRRRVLYLAA